MKTVFDLFSIDLKTLPSANCVETGTTTNSSGDQITEYTLALDRAELGLFKMMRILQFQNGAKNVGFYNPNLASVNVSSLERLINTLYSFYGNDSNVIPRGAFTAEDQHDVQSTISDPDNNFWIGRQWTNLDKHAVMLTLDNNGLELFVHGVPK